MRPNQEIVRPLVGGIRIVNPINATPGTIGFIAQAADGGPWIVSCWHVLIRPPLEVMRKIPSGEPVLQPGPEMAGPPLPVHVASTDSQRGDPALDCSAARVLPGVAVSAEVLDLGKVGPPLDPRVGMHVVKSGMRTGVTGGIVKRVDGSMVRIEPVATAPRDYVLSNAGDSGALWVEQASMRPIAMHRRGNVTLPEFALASAIIPVLNALNLRFLV